jgi:hypothetical protein
MLAALDDLGVAPTHFSTVNTECIDLIERSAARVRHANRSDNSHWVGGFRVPRACNCCAQQQVFRAQHCCRELRLRLC